jgi:hypothetical protein
MPNQAGQIAARAALAEASRYLATAVHDLTVVELLRRRRANTKEPFYFVTVEAPNGTRLSYQVSDDGRRVEAEGLYGKHSPVASAD